MDEKELVQEILDCLPIEGDYDGVGGYMDCQREDIDATVQYLLELIKQREQQLYEDVKALHSALNEFLPLFILGNGTDYAGIDEAIEALQRHPELPITVALAEMKGK